MRFEIDTVVNEAQEYIAKKRMNAVGGVWMSGTATEQEVNLRTNSLKVRQARMDRKVPSTGIGWTRALHVCYMLGRVLISIL